MTSLVIEHLLQSTLFAVFLGLITLCFTNNRAAVRYWLWFAASVKFLIPFSLIVGIGEYLRWETAPAVALDIPWSAEAIAPLVSPIVTPTASTLTTASDIGLAPTQVAFEPASSGLDLGSVLIAIWVIGSAFLFCRWMVQGMRLAAVRKASRPAPTNVANTAAIPVRLSNSLFEPGLVGIFRPVLLQPEGIALQLSPSQIALVIEHELCHWRRRDNLTAAIHMATELVFWFNPLVWWIGARLIVERENACDESVLATCDNPTAYADSILEVCRFYVRSPLACAPGVAGANLKHRVERIVADINLIRVSGAKRVLLTAIAVATLVLPMAAGVLTPSAIAALPPQPDVPADMIPQHAAPSREVVPQPVAALTQEEQTAPQKAPAPKPAPKAAPSPMIAHPVADETRSEALPSKGPQDIVTASLAPPIVTQQLMQQAVPAAEEIVVTGNKILDYVRTRTFVHSYTAPSTFVDQISRWDAPLCVDTSGMAPRYNAFVTARIKDIAAQIGAPRVKTGSCDVDLKIVFSVHPQEQVDDMKHHFPVLLGPHYPAMRDRLASITHPIEAWYATGTRDSRGRWQLDHHDTWFNTMPGGNLESFPVYYVPGSRLRTGMTSDFAKVVIVADIDKIEGRDIGTVADYIAMMAFARAKTLDKCQELPSISNAFANCSADTKATALSPYDIAYLKALYRTTSDVPHDVQQSAIGAVMQSLLEQQVALQKGTPAN